MHVSLELSSRTKKFCGVTNNRQFELLFRVLRIFISFELLFVFGKIHRSSTNFVCITFTQYCMPSTDILVYPIDSVANIVNSIKEDKIAKRAKFCIPLRAATL